MRIGYLGVGKMGQPMAGKLLDAGHELFVHDISAEAMRPLLERQARQAASPKELADICDTVIVSLPTLEIFQHALSGPDGLLAGNDLGEMFGIELETAAAPVSKSSRRPRAARTAKPTRNIEKTASALASPRRRTAAKTSKRTAARVSAKRKPIAKK